MGENPVRTALMDDFFIDTKPDVEEKKGTAPSLPPYIYIYSIS